MRSLKSLSLIAAGAMLAAGSALAAGPAMADPIANHGGKAVSPKPYDIVGVGSDTDETLFDQLTVDYNASHKIHNATHPYIYSWDATPPSTPLNLTSKIVAKSGCAKVARPDGSGAGIAQFEAPGYKTHGHLCIGFARSASYRASSDHYNYGPGGDLYVAIAEDAETYTVTAGGNAPTNLTLADLVGIYNCTYTNWDQVGGKNAPIEALLPPSSAGVTKFWLTALGLQTAAACINKNDTLVVQQNEGIDTKIFGTKGHPNPNVIVPYSVGKYIAQRYHSAAIGKTPNAKQNRFGRDEHGDLVLGSVSGFAPTVGTGTATKININIRKAGNFIRPLFDVVWYAVHSKNGDHIPSNLEPFFAAARGVKIKGWFCANPEAQHAIESYGFLTSRECGFGT